MKFSMKCAAAAAAALVALSGAAQAALIDRGNGLIYDSTRNITWMKDMNYAATSGWAAQNETQSFGVNRNGWMTWEYVNQWVAQLNYGGYSSGWRLPTLNPLDSSCSGEYLGFKFGFNCTGGELSGLFVTELGNGANQLLSDETGKTPAQIANYGLFINVQDSYYWSGTPDTYVPDADLPDINDENESYVYGGTDSFGRARGRVLGFGTEQGVQDGYGILDSTFFAVAVRDGDVSVVPAPSTLALALLALGATVVARKRQSL